MAQPGRGHTQKKRLSVIQSDSSNCPGFRLDDGPTIPHDWPTKASRFLDAQQVQSHFALRNRHGKRSRPPRGCAIPMSANQASHLLLQHNSLQDLSQHTIAEELKAMVLQIFAKSINCLLGSNHRLLTIMGHTRPGTGLSIDINQGPVLPITAPSAYLIYFAPLNCQEQHS